MKALALLICLTVSVQGMDRLDALWMLETGGNDRLVGKAGEISRYQVRVNLWHSVTSSRQYDSPETARAVVQRVMATRIHEFDATFKRTPTDFEYYALWNAPSQVMNGHISRAVAARCRRFCNLCTRSPDSQSRRATE